MVSLRVPREVIGADHLRLYSTLLSFVGCIWGALSPTYNQLYGARILMGAGMASYA